MEEKDVQRLLDMLYGMIDEAKSVAFSSDKCIIVRDEALDLLDEIRAKLPLELKKAQELIAARSEVTTMMISKRSGKLYSTSTVRESSASTQPPK